MCLTMRFGGSFPAPARRGGAASSRSFLAPEGVAPLILRIILGFAALGTIAGLLRGGVDVAAQRYLPLGLTRNAALLLEGEMNRVALAGFAFGLVSYLAGSIAPHLLRRTIARPFPFGLSVTTAALLFLRFGWSYNRYSVSTLWKEKTALLGVPLPKALVTPEALAVNGGIAVGSGLVALLLYRAIRAWLDRRGGGAFPLRRTVTILTGAGALLLAAANAADPLLFRDRRPEGPNVLLISLDNLRADGLGCYGAERPTSPAVDAFAGECVLFENAHSQSPHTLPSHASFLTSRYPSVNHASIGGNRLPAARVLGTELFREAGYRTLGIVDTPFLTDRYGLEQGYDRFAGWGRGAVRIVPAARGRLAKEGGGPFFFFVHIYDIHAPYAKDPAYKRMFLDFDYRGNVSPEGHVLAEWQKKTKEGGDPGFEIGGDDGRYLQALYDGGIRSTDDLLAPLLRDVTEGPLGEKTIVVVTSDHGEEFLEHGQVLHDDLYRTLTHVPLLIRLPGGARGGTRIAEPVGLIDILPTLVELTGIPAPVPLDGRSLVPLMEGGERPERPVFGEMPRGGGRVAVLTGRWHLVGHPEGEEWELFRYGLDRFEQFDLSVRHPDRVDSLRALLDLWRLDLQGQKLAEPHLEAEAADVDEETRARLRALGYLDE